MIFGGKPVIHINLKEEPKFIYSPQTPIEGHVRIELKKKLNDVSSIVCGLRGHTSIEDTLSNEALTDQVKRIAKNGIFVDIVKNIPHDDERSKSHTIDKNTIIETDFHFETPTDCFFPSSRYYQTEKYQEIRIWYTVYVEIYKFNNDNSQKLFIESSKKISIQGGQDPRFGKDLSFIPYKQYNTFNDKVKKFYYDTTLSALVPTSITSNHFKTKSLRKLWNDDYKPENYNLYTKTIPLTMIFSVPSSFDMSKPLYTQLKLDFECDLRSIGIKSNQTTDFVFNNQSTGLGIFRIQSVTIDQEVKRIVSQGELSATHYESVFILSSYFHDLIIDVEDFQYNKETETYVYSLDSEQFCHPSNRVHLPLIERLCDTMVSNGEIRIIDQNDVSSFTEVPVTYTILSNLKFTWVISDGGSQERTYIFETNCTPDFII